ncbi:replicative DNA helicase [Helicobacter brantae]|uniref:Replicative DNA helicase n=1 Tax=Helicobacter brantae TaxID=375927 RepID=A0A3D8J0U8_9HELI|nr:replicative DNA helicase [Helicobacter brantae]RDU70993.1 replicative DNA helicase [Helicobacter brantae]
MEGLGLQNIERTILATLFFEPNLFDDVASVLSEGDFSDPFHQLLFKTIRTQIEQSKPATPDFIKPLIASDRRYDESELLSIIALSPVADVTHYANQVKNYAIKRQLLSLATKITKSISDDQKEAEDVLAEIEREIFDISLSGESKDFRDSPSVIQSTLEMINELKAKGNNILTGLNTGFAELNRITTGFNAGELIIIGARPSMGKTTFVLNMVQKFLSTGKGVAFFSLEMQAEHLMLRMLSSATSIPLQDLRIGNLSDEKWEDLSASANFMAKQQLFIDDNSHLTITQLKSKMRKLKLKYPEVSALVVDYLQLMSGSKGGGGEGKRQEEISEISRGLKILAREMQIPVIALSQLNRGLENREDKRPQLSDLRESGAIEQDADVILFLYRDDVYRKKEEKAKEEKAKKEGNKYTSQYEEKNIEKAEIIVAKNRNGETKTVKIQFNKACIRFEESSEQEEEALKTRLENSRVEEVSFARSPEVVEMPKV